MTFIIGIICSIMTALGLMFAIGHGYAGRYQRSHDAEITAILWLIAALICFR